MTMIVLIAIAAGSASALMFASIISRALISLLLLYFTPLPLMVAALGWGPLAATIGGIGAATVLGAIFGLPFCIAFVVMMALPAWWLGHLALLGRPVSNAGSSDGATPAAPVLEWYPIGRLAALDRRLWRSVHDGDPAYAGHRRCHHHRDTAGGLAADPQPPRRGFERRHQATDRCRGDDRACRRRQQRHDHADAQLLAGRPDRGDIGTIASPVARPEKHRAAADDAGGIVGRHRVLFFRRAARDAGSGHHRGAVDDLRADRLRGAAHADDGVERPRTLAGLRSTRSWWCPVAGSSLR